MCSASEVLRHPGNAAEAPVRKDLEEHRRSVGICLVNNNGMVFAARYVAVQIVEEAYGVQVFMKVFHALCYLKRAHERCEHCVRAAAPSLLMLVYRRVDDKHGTWQMPQVGHSPQQNECS